MNKAERETLSTRLAQLPYTNKRYMDISYNNKLTNRLKKLSNSSKQINILPRIYAKAEELNRKLSTHLLVQNDSIHDANSQEMNLDSLSDKDLFLKQYNRTRKRSMIVSKYLDDDMKIRLEQMRNYGMMNNRRFSNSTTDSFSSENKIKDLSDLEINDDLTEMANSNYINEVDFFNSNNAKSISESANKIKNPRFGSMLSKDAQFALMKSLEDTIVNEIEKSYPELKNRIPRTTTAQYLKRKHSNCSTESSFDNGNSNNRNFNQLASSNSIENLKYESEIFSEDNGETSQLTKVKLNDDLNKQLAVSQQINSAMEILDNLRVGKLRKATTLSALSAAKKDKINHRIHFNSNIDYSNNSSNNNKHSASFTRSKTSAKTVSSLNSNSPSSSLPTARNRVDTSKSMSLNKLDTIDKYAQWKNRWMNQLDSI